jgi:hypothetical protein
VMDSNESVREEPAWMRVLRRSAYLSPERFRAEYGMSREEYVERAERLGAYAAWIRGEAGDGPRPQA